MNICIVGCGAIGGIYGVHLAQLDNIKVWAYDPDQAQVQAINTGGLQLSGSSTLHARISATSDASIIPACDFGIISTKSFHTSAAMQATAHVFGSGVLCCLQNGIGNEALAAEWAPAVLSGSTLVGGHVAAPGHVVFDTEGQTWLGPDEHGSATLSQAGEFAAMLNRAGLTTEAVQDPRGVKWAKLIFNSAANPVCALSRLPFHSMYSQAGLRELSQGLAREGVAVAAAQNIALAFNPLDKLEDTFQQGVQQGLDHVPSTLTDVLNGRKTEIGVLNGAISRAGLALGLPCPLNDGLAALVLGLDSAARA